MAASLAVSDLKEPYEAWAFIVLQGLVRDKPGDREAFVTLVEAVAGREPIPGPSDALLIAGELTKTGAATERAAAPDPFGKVAKERRQQVESWKRASPSSLPRLALAKPRWSANGSLVASDLSLGCR